MRVSSAFSRSGSSSASTSPLLDQAVGLDIDRADDARPLARDVNLGRRLDLAGGLHLDHQVAGLGRHRLVGDGAGLALRLQIATRRRRPPGQRPAGRSQISRRTQVRRRLLASRPSAASISAWVGRVWIFMVFRIVAAMSCIIDGKTAHFRRIRLCGTLCQPDMSLAMSDIKFETVPDGTKLAFREDGGEDVGRCGLFWLGGFKSDMAGLQGRGAGRTGARHPAAQPSASTIPAMANRAACSSTADLGLARAILPYVHPQGTGPAHHRRLEHGRLAGPAALPPTAAEEPARRPPRRGPGADCACRRHDRRPDVGRVPRSGAARNWRKRASSMRPSLYGEPYPITARLITDGEKHLMLKDGLDCDCPVRILQGDADPDVPATHASRCSRRCAAADITLTLMKGGDHRLSSPGPVGADPRDRPAPGRARRRRQRLRSPASAARPSR